MFLLYSITFTVTNYTDLLHKHGLKKCGLVDIKFSLRRCLFSILWKESSVSGLYNSQLQFSVLLTLRETKKEADEGMTIAVIT